MGEKHLAQRLGWQPDLVTPIGRATDYCPGCNHPMWQHFNWTQQQYDRGGRWSHTLTEKGCADCPQFVCIMPDYRPVYPTEKIEPIRESGKMSAVNLCERCDSFMLGKAVATLDIAISPTAPAERKEMCPGCIADLMEFLSESPKREGRAFREPYSPPEVKESPTELL